MAIICFILYHKLESTNKTYHFYVTDDPESDLFTYREKETTIKIKIEESLILLNS